VPTPVQAGDTLRISGSIVTLHAEGEGSPGIPPSSHTVFHRAEDLLARGRAPRPDLAAEEALRLHAARLDVLNDVHRALGRSLAQEELLELILDRVFEHLRPEHGALYLKQPDGELQRAAGRSLHDRGGEELYSRSLAREVTEKGLAALVLDVTTDERFAAAASILSAGVRSLVAAPLLDPDSGSLGMIVLASKAAVRQFNEADLELLVSLASVAALYLRNVALAQEAAERRRLEEELRLARRIQEALLPAGLPAVPGWELQGGNVPSRGVSGDYYEATLRRDGAECVLLVADVAGKGMAASLLTAALQAFCAGPVEDGLAPEAICGTLSRRLHRRTPPEKYATVFVAALDLGSGRLRYANAGHNPALLVRAGGGVERLGATGVPIALLPAATYGAAEAVLEPGDLLLLYTDGFVEATDPDGAEFGLDRLQAIAVGQRAAGGAGLAVELERELLEFARGVPFADDRTFVLARRLPA
jgi:serine phosphatase RsbU (regulator of sigma subunit)